MEVTAEQLVDGLSNDNILERERAGIKLNKALSDPGEHQCLTLNCHALLWSCLCRLAVCFLHLHGEPCFCWLGLRCSHKGPVEYFNNFTFRLRSTSRRCRPLGQAGGGSGGMCSVRPLVVPPGRSDPRHGKFSLSSLPTKYIHDTVPGHASMGILVRSAVATKC